MAVPERKLLFVINPIAGGRDKDEVTAEIQNCCRDVSLYPHIYETTGRKEHDEAMIRKMMQELKPDALVAVGGDGTIHLVGNILTGTDMPLGIIPAGSANGLAKDLGIPEDFPGALEVIKKFSPRPIDTLKLNNHNCFHISDLGFNARICHRFAESLIRGKLSYAWYALQEFFTYKFFRYSIDTLEGRIEGKAFMMILTNANKFGTNLSINPSGTIDDGFFEISIIKPFPKYTAPAILHRLYNNTIAESKYFKTLKCKHALIHNMQQEFCHIDGEPVNIGETIEAKIVPGGLKVLI